MEFEPGQLPMPGKGSLFEAADPRVNGTGIVTKELGHLRAAKSARNQQNAADAMIVAEFLRSHDFSVHYKPNDGRILDFQLARCSVVSGSTIPEGK